jgi:uncharacterized SAM-binding protein YcdF (DUF218 family)
MGRLIRFFFQLLALALVIVLLTAAWIIVDGLNDVGEKSDVGLVESFPSLSGGVATPALDRLVQLYHQDQIHNVIVTGSSLVTNRTNPEEAVRYLEEKGIPSAAISVDQNGATTLDTARSAVEIMKSHRYESVMIVTDYFRMTRLKLALEHEGMADILKAHVGKFQKEDVWNIGREVAALYEYLGKYYIMPEAEKVKAEAKIGADKAGVEAEKAKKSVDKSLDNMPK